MKKCERRSLFGGGWIGNSLQQLVERGQLFRLHGLLLPWLQPLLRLNPSPLALFSFCSNLGFPSEPDRCLLPIARNALKLLKNYAAS
jgi:hypothetical protein